MRRPKPCDFVSYGCREGALCTIKSIIEHNRTHVKQHQMLLAQSKPSEIAPDECKRDEFKLRAGMHVKLRHSGITAITLGPQNSQGKIEIVMAEPRMYAGEVHGAFDVNDIAYVQ